MPSALVRPAALVEKFFQFSLLGLVASGFFALAGTGRLDYPTIILTSAGLLLRALMLVGIVRLTIPAKVLSGAALALLVFYPVDFYFLSREYFAATVHGICFLSVLRILSAKNGRDYLYTGAIAFLQLLGAALLSFQATFFIWLTLAVVFSIGAFTSADIRRGYTHHDHSVPVSRTRLTWHLGFVALSSTVWILILSAGLFFIIPRGARAAAQLFPNMHHITGFSNVVDLGRFGEITKDDRAVMHVLSYSRAMPLDLKWRGTALSRFDGKRWSEPPQMGLQLQNPRGSVLVADPYQRSRRGQRYIYRVDISNADTGTLFIAGIPEFLNVEAPRLLRTAEDSFQVFPPNGDRLRYEVSAHMGTPLPYILTAGERRRYLDLPPIDTRIWSLAREWAGEGSDQQRALAIQNRLRKDFVYTLNTGPVPARDPLGHFLFETKSGYCEYFASAMAVMLRTLGIPSRVATGFQSGYFNPVSGMQVIRASDAHAWVEGWIDGRGWVTFDPTPPGSGAAPSGWLAQAAMYLDALDGAWQQWVMSYDLNRQASLAARFESAIQAWRARNRGAAATNPGTTGLSSARTWAEWGFGIAALLAALWIFGPRLLRWFRRTKVDRRIRRTGGQASDAGILYERMLETLSRRGFQKPVWFTPLEFARNLPAEESRQVEEFTRVYNRVRFGGDVGAAGTLVDMLRMIEVTGRH